MFVLLLYLLVILLISMDTISESVLVSFDVFYWTTFILICDEYSHIYLD